MFSISRSIVGSELGLLGERRGAALHEHDRVDRGPVGQVAVDEDWTWYFGGGTISWTQALIVTIGTFSRPSA